jgi:hypothetical protein
MKNISHTTRAFFQYPLRRCRIGIRSRIITSHHRVQLIPHFFASFFHFLADFQQQQPDLILIAVYGQFNCPLPIKMTRRRAN